MPATPTPHDPAAPTTDLAGWFACEKATAEREQRFDARITEMLRVFLASPAAHSPLALDKVAAPLRDTRLPDAPRDPAEYLDELNRHVVAHASHVGAPRFVGHMTTALPFFTRPLARLLTALNQNNVKVETSKSTTPLEQQTLAMLHGLIFGQDPAFHEKHVHHLDSTLGIMTGGGTVANITALWIARNRSLGPDPDRGFSGVEEEGLSAALRHYQSDDACVIGSSLMHFSFDKASGLLGLGRRGFVKAPVDECHRVRLDAIRAALEDARARRRRVIALVGIAGTTDSGAVDPLNELADLAAEFGVHFHVDAAWGGPTLFSRTHGHLLGGIARADSVTMDGHKQLYCPMGLGVLLLRDPLAARVIERSAQYIIREGSADLGRRSLEGSRPAMALFLHATLNLLGREGLAALMDEGLRKARYLSRRIAERPEFEVLCEPQLNILLYRFVPRDLRGRTARLAPAETALINRVNTDLQKTERLLGESFVSRTALDPDRFGTGEGIVALRAVLANPLTTDADLDAVLDEQARLGEQL